jgi:hypothetical protein
MHRVCSHSLDKLWCSHTNIPRSQTQTHPLDLHHLRCRRDYCPDPWCCAHRRRILESERYNDIKQHSPRRFGLSSLHVSCIHRFVRFVRIQSTRCIIPTREQGILCIFYGRRVAILFARVLPALGDEPRTVRAVEHPRGVFRDVGIHAGCVGCLVAGSVASGTLCAAGCAWWRWRYGEEVIVWFLYIAVVLRALDHIAKFNSSRASM